MRRLGENRRDRGAVGAAEPVPVERDLPGASGQSCGAPGTHRRRDIGDRIARLVIDCDKLGPVARDRLAFGDDERDGLAGMADAFAGQRRTIRHDQPGAVRDRAGERHVADAGRSISASVSTARTPGSAAPRWVDGADRGKGMRRADEHGMRLAGFALVVAETPGAGQQAAVLVARLERQAHPGFLQLRRDGSAVSLPQACARGQRQKQASAEHEAGVASAALRHCDRDASHRAPMLI